MTSRTTQLSGYRKMALELLFAERNHICSVCVSSGHCEIQSLAQEHGVTSVRYPYRFPKLTPDTSQTRYVFDPNRCVLCASCVRTFAEIEGAHVWEVAGRGIASGPVSELQRPWCEAASCTSCVKCVQACPTGAIAEKGWAAEEMSKDRSVVSTLNTMREGQ